VLEGGRVVAEVLIQLPGKQRKLPILRIATPVAAVNLVPDSVQLLRYAPDQGWFRKYLGLSGPARILVRSVQTLQVDGGQRRENRCEHPSDPPDIVANP
jgi:hypothetical protein